MRSVSKSVVVNHVFDSILYLEPVNTSDFSSKPAGSRLLMRGAVLTGFSGVHGLLSARYGINI